tara:strand:+ start:555 stop:749 length:195 start_codon:yes stop_codon:yes gene_type:complete
MRLVFIVDDAEHDDSAGLNIKEEAKLNHVSEDVIINDIQDQFWEFAQSWELNCKLLNIEQKEKK